MVRTRLRLAATLRWAAAAAEGRVDWAEQDLGTKAALGRGSSLAGRVCVRVLAPRLGDLAERLATPGAVALDVGTGVGEFAVALALAAPSLRVVGIDVLDDVLAEAVPAWSTMGSLIGSCCVVRTW